MAETGTRYKEKFKELNCCVLIPTYNNQQTLSDVILGVKQYTDQVIIINDGSTDETLDIIQNLDHLEYVSYKKNQGKGYALRKGFEYALEKGYEYAITIDSDGQHFVEDLPKFIDYIDKNPNSLVVGSRNMDQDSVPGKSSFGHRFSNFWYWVETGIKLPDTQSGYRLYPIDLLKKTRFFTKKYEFEIEVIVRAAWKGIKVDSVPIKVYYAPKEERVSHFRPFRDFSRVSLLNTILVFFAFLFVKPFNFIKSLNRKNIKIFLDKHILKNQESSLRLSTAIAFGVFMGVTPIWGYQMLAALALSHLFRLNKVIVLVASNISIPPMIPLILYGSFKTGGFFIHSDKLNLANYTSNLSFDLIKDHFLQYVIGSLVFGAALGILFGIVSYISICIFRNKKRKVMA